jgi:hypothetical protein
MMEVAAWLVSTVSENSWSLALAMVVKLRHKPPD